MSRRTIAAGVVGSVLQTVGGAAITLVSFRFVRDTVGPEHFGVWAAVGALASAGSLAELGLGGAALRYVSLHLGEGNEAEARRVAETALLTSIALVGTLALGLALVLPALLGWVWNPDAIALLPEAGALLPWTLGLLAANVVQSVCLSCLDAVQRVHQRNAVALSVAAGGLAMTLWLVPRHGLIGFAQALTVQALVGASVGWLLVRRQMPGLSRIPRTWRWATLRTLLRFGMAWQGISFVNLFTEPLAKLLIGRYAGLTLLGHYEIVTRLAQPVRGVLISAQQALLPTLSRLHPGDHDLRTRVYRALLRTSTATVGWMLPVLLLGAPLVAIGWVGRPDLTFERLYAVMMAAWMLTAVAGPAYFDHIGRGTMLPVFASHATTAGMVALLGPLAAAAGERMGGVSVLPGALVIGVVALAIVTGNFVVTAVLHRRDELRWRTLLDPPDRLVLATGIGLSGIALSVTLAGVGSPLLRLALAAGAAVVGLGPLVAHPELRQGLRRLRTASATPAP